MNDEIQQPAPEPQPALPVSGEVPDIRKRGMKGSLENLPPEIKKDIDDYFQSHNGPATQKYIKEKYVAQYPHLTTLTLRTVYVYAKKNKLKTLREAIVGTGLLDLTTQMAPIIETSLDPNANLDDKRAAIIKVYKDLSDTFDKLKAAQKNFIDPQACAVLSKLGTDLLKIVETAKKYDAEVATVKQKDINEETDPIIGLCAVAMQNAFKLTQPDQSHYSEFMAVFKERIKECFNNYRQVKGVLRENPFNIN